MMTKQEFDLLFPNEKCLVRASNTEEWLAVHDWAVKEYDLNPSGSRNNHDYMRFPYVFVQTATYAVDATNSRGRGEIISFAEWQEIVSEKDENVKLCSADLADIL
nr:MAG TPA: hypothetical protein [Caudoviricetes sp.]